MALGPRLDLRQTQTLVMTPQLRQAIKLLQYSNIEVAAFVEEELERNPLLERDDSAETPIAERAAPDQLPERAHREPTDWRRCRARRHAAVARRRRRSIPITRETYDAGGVADGGAARRSISGRGGAHDFDGDERGIDDIADARRPLRDHLGEQLRLSLRRSGGPHDRRASDRAAVSGRPADRRAGGDRRRRWRCRWSASRRCARA